MHLKLSGGVAPSAHHQAMLTLCDDCSTGRMHAHIQIYHVHLLAELFLSPHPDRHSAVLLLQAGHAGCCVWSVC
jgi:hypothetical protein